MAGMTQRMTFAELEDLVREDPELDVDEALEYGGWFAESVRERRRRPAVWPAALLGGVRPPVQAEP